MLSLSFSGPLTGAQTDAMVATIGCNWVGPVPIVSVSVCVSHNVPVWGCNGNSSNANADLAMRQMSRDQLHGDVRTNLFESYSTMRACSTYGLNTANGLSSQMFCKQKPQKKS